MHRGRCPPPRGGLAATTGRTGSKWPASDDEALSNQPEARRQAILVAAAPRAKSTYLVHSS